MQIHLSKPGGQREGPFTIDQINRDLANRKYRDADYWAWYEGLDAWVPLHSVPGVLILPDSATPSAVPPASPQKAVSQARAGAASSAQAKASASQPSDGVSGDEASGSADSADVDSSGEAAKLASGLPFAALKQFYVFTSGEGPSAMKSPITAKMVKAIVGEDLAKVREKVPRDVFGRCDIAERMRLEKTVPNSAWRAMSSLNAELVQKAREGAYRTCVRIFPIENDEAVAVFLFYDKSGK
jgi:hypothetical protein